MKDTVLVVEDDPDIVELVQYNLEREGFSVLTAEDGEKGLKEAVSRKPAIILLDLMLPGMGGLEVCKQLKSRNDTDEIPIVMMTAKGEESDVVLGLELGADDYVKKPFSPKELVARVRAVLRRGGLAHPEEARRIETGPVAIDHDRHEIKIRGKSVGLTLAEYRLFSTLASQPGRVFTREQLLEQITGGESVVIERNVDVHVRSIRKKLKKDGDLIETVRGVGYKFRE